MKRQLGMILFAMLVITLAFPAGLAMAQGGDFPIKQGTVDTSSALAVRAEQGISGEVLGTIEPGEVVDVFEIDGNWAYIKYNDLEGWTFANSLDLQPAQVNLQGVADTSSDLALRTEPAITADVVKTVPPGTVLGVLLLDEEWAFVYDGVDTGWTFAGTLDLTPPTPDLTNLASATGVVSTSSAVALRAEPDLSGEVVTTVEDGDEVEVLAYDDTGLFALVLYVEEGITGWAFTQNFSIEDIGVAVGSLADVAGGISFRDAPDGDRFFYLYYPGNVVVLGRSEDGEWLKIRYPDVLTIGGEEIVGQEGWLATSLIDTDADIDSLPVVEEAE